MSVAPRSVSRAARGPAALAVLIAAASLAGTPAHASARVPMHQCWVNDVAAPPGDQVNGTSGDDNILCDSDLVNVTVSGLGGNDHIEVKGLVIDSLVQGGEGDDVIRAKHLVAQDSFSMVRGNRGNDTITVATVHGRGAAHGATVRGDDGDDKITTGSVWGAPGEFSRGGGLVDGNDGADTIVTGTVDFQGRVIGGSENDRIEVEALGPESGGLIQSGPGDDTITGPGGALLTVGEHWGTVDAGVGNDTCAVQSVSTRTNISSCEVFAKGSIPQRPAGKPQNPSAPGTATKPAAPAAPAQPAAQPAPQAQPATQLVTKPAQQPAAQPVTKPATQPAQQPAGKPATH
ncbi:hypothetical protein [Streptomyces sp. NPDC003943]